MSAVRDTRAIMVLSAVILLIAAAFAIYGAMVQDALHATRVNTRRIDRNQYETCIGLNRAFTRSNSVIDQAIRAELAQPNPDLVRIDALRRFRLPIRECGARP